MSTPSPYTKTFLKEIESAETVEEVLDVISEVTFCSTQQDCGVRGGFDVCERTVKAAAAKRLYLIKPLKPERLSHTEEQRVRHWYQKDNALEKFVFIIFILITLMFGRCIGQLPTKAERSAETQGENCGPNH